MDNVGLIIRTTAGVYVCYVNKKKKMEIIPYSEFLADDYNRFIKIRYKDKVKENDSRDEKSSILFMKKLKEYWIIFIFIISSCDKFGNSLDLLCDYFYSMQMCDDRDEEKDSNFRMGRVDSPFPLCIQKKNKNYVYSRSLIVRSENKKI